MSFLKRFSALLKPQLSVGGLDVSDAAIRFVELQGSTLQKMGVSLDPGVIEDGRLKNAEQFLQALKSLKEQLGRSRDTISVILSLPPNHIYTQAFSLPLLNEANIKEAAALNLQMLSPVDVKTSYTDWERLNEEQEGNKIELLGAFVTKTVVDEFLAVLEQAGFMVAAVEFPSLAISRAMKMQTVGIDLQKPRVVLAVSGDGLDFLIIKDGKVYFSYFVSWSSIKGGVSQDSREILLTVFNQILIQEMKKIFTFYSSHWGGQAAQLTLITHGLYQEIEKIIKEAFPTIEVQPLQLRDFPDLPASWFVACGSALRGLIPRAEDNFISLSPVDTEEQFAHNEIKSFVKIWESITITTLGFLVIAFAASDGFLWRTQQAIENDLSALDNNPAVQEMNELAQKAIQFNALAQRALAAKIESSDFLPLFHSVIGTAQNSAITITTLIINNDRTTGVVGGKAANRTAIVTFKNRLAEIPGIKSVDLKPADVQDNPEGTVSFVISFQLL